MNALAPITAIAPASDAPVAIIRDQVAALGGYSKAALFDFIASDLRRERYDDDVADLANALADVIRDTLRSDDRALHGGEVRS